METQKRNEKGIQEKLKNAVVLRKRVYSYMKNSCMERREEDSPTEEKIEAYRKDHPHTR